MQNDWLFLRDRPFTVNHIPQTTQSNAIKTPKFAGRGLQPILPVWFYYGLDDRVLIHPDSFKINPKHNSDGAMKSTSPCSATSPGEIRDFLFYTRTFWIDNHNKEHCSSELGQMFMQKDWSQRIFYLKVTISVNLFSNSINWPEGVMNW
jgi:hypothetical protein